MKRVILPLLFVILLSQFSYSQSLGVRAGLNISSVRVDGDESVEPLSRIGFNLGVVTEFKFNKMLGLETGLIYTSKGSKEEYTDDYFDETISTKNSLSLNYLEIPISCVMFYRINSVLLNFNVGPYLAYGIGGTINIDRSGMGESFEIEEDVKYGSGENEINPIDYGLNFGLGARYSSFQLGINYELGLADLYNDKSEVKLKNSNIMFNLCYYLNLNSY